MSSVIVVSERPKCGSSLVCVRPRLNSETQKRKINMINPRTASNYDLIFVAIFLFKWKNLAG